MKTKIVYVVASLYDDVYMEQAIGSAWSVRHHNPDCHIEMVCDQDTFATFKLGIRAQYKDLFDEIHVREFQSELSMIERSRWMKTTLREIIDGDYLYIDTDTVVCADLSYIDDFDFEIGMVLDCNCKFGLWLTYEWLLPIMKERYNMDVSNETQYFNSGVAYVRDCQVTHDLYKRWNELWIDSLHKFNDKSDQKALMKANIDMGHIIEEISGNLNCQIIESIQYLHTAHIMHFFNHTVGKTNHLSPLYKELYLQIKQNGLTKDVQDIILNCKSSFASPSMPVPIEGAKLWVDYLKRPKTSEGLETRVRSSNSYKLIHFLWFHTPRFMKVVDAILGTARCMRNVCK